MITYMTATIKQIKNGDNWKLAQKLGLPASSKTFETEVGGLNVIFAMSRLNGYSSIVIMAHSVEGQDYSYPDLINTTDGYDGVSYSFKNLRGLSNAHRYDTTSKGVRIFGSDFFENMVVDKLPMKITGRDADLLRDTFEQFARELDDFFDVESQQKMYAMLENLMGPAAQIPVVQVQL